LATGVAELLVARSALVLVGAGPETKLTRLLPCAPWFAGAGTSDAAAALAATLNSIGGTYLPATSTWISGRSREAGLQEEEGGRQEEEGGRPGNAGGFICRRGAARVVRKGVREGMVGLEPWKRSWWDLGVGSGRGRRPSR